MKTKAMTHFQSAHKNLKKNIKKSKLARSIYWVKRPIRLEFLITCFL